MTKAKVSGRCHTSAVSWFIHSCSLYLIQVLLKRWKQWKTMEMLQDLSIVPLHRRSGAIKHATTFVSWKILNHLSSKLCSNLVHMKQNAISVYRLTEMISQMSVKQTNVTQLNVQTMVAGHQNKGTTSIAKTTLYLSYESRKNLK